MKYQAILNIKTDIDVTNKKIFNMKQRLLSTYDKECILVSRVNMDNGYTQYIYKLNYIVTTKLDDIFK